MEDRQRKDGGTLMLGSGPEAVRVDVVYEKRKKLLLVVEPPGLVRLKAPRGAREADLLASLEERRDWIAAQMAKLRAASGGTPGPEPDGAPEARVVRYQGQGFPLRLLPAPAGQREEVKLGGGCLTFHGADSSEEVVQRALKRFYHRQCRQLVLRRITHYQAFFKEKPAAVEIRESANKWGQCSSERRLMFNWHLILAPPEALDYVVVHEMCHLVHMNHDRSFWRLLGSILPDYQDRQALLAREGLAMDY